MKIISSLKCTEYGQPGHPESPERIKSSWEFLKLEGYDIVEPSTAAQEDVLLAHSKGLLEQVESGTFVDADTPAFPGIMEHALLSAGAAIDAAKISFNGDFGFSLMRPPGHHATEENLGGFCYFNNIAIATKSILAKAKKVAILDIDVHHGNGTEDIFKGKDNVLFISLHQSPLYPGSGLYSKKNCLNFPLASGTTEVEYLDVFKQAILKLHQFNPGLIGMSCGFDTFAEDHLAGISLNIDSYYKIAQLVSQLRIPVFCVLEGGYSRALPQCIDSFLQGFE